MENINKNIWLKLSAMMVGASFLATPSHAASPGALDFQILLNDRVIGYHRVTVTGGPNNLTANIAISMDGRIGPVAYRYTHSCTENWQGRQLVFADCTDSLGNNIKRVRVTQSENQLAINGPEYRGTAPLNAMPSSWWRSEVTQTSSLINTVTGNVARPQFVNLGADTVATTNGTVNATHYRLARPINTELWYDASGRWVKTQFRFFGQTFVYRLASPVSSAPRGS